MKKILKRIVPHIIPELILFFTKILPAAIVIALLLFYPQAVDYYQSDVKVIIYGILTCAGGIYLMRITAYAIKSTLIKIKNIIPDVYYDESLNNQS